MDQVEQNKQKLAASLQDVLGYDMPYSCKVTFIDNIPVNDGLYQYSENNLQIHIELPEALAHFEGIKRSAPANTSPQDDEARTIAILIAARIFSDMKAHNMHRRIAINGYLKWPLRIILWSGIIYPMFLTALAFGIIGIFPENPEWISAASLDLHAVQWFFIFIFSLFGLSVHENLVSNHSSPQKSKRLHMMNFIKKQLCEERLGPKWNYEYFLKLTGKTLRDIEAHKSSISVNLDEIRKIFWVKKHPLIFCYQNEIP